MGLKGLPPYYEITRSLMKTPKRLVIANIPFPYNFDDITGRNGKISFMLCDREFVPFFNWKGPGAFGGGLYLIEQGESFIGPCFSVSNSYKKCDCSLFRILR